MPAPHPGGRRRRRWWPVAGVVASMCCGAVLARTAFLQPPRWPAPGAPRLVGSYHVHSARSHDARVPAARWARAARERTLDFVVLTDHDAPYAPPTRVHGVLLLPQTELSTKHGHLVALGGGPVADLAGAAARGGPAGVRAAGALPIAAHPSSPKRPWTGDSAHLTGTEPASLSAQFDAAVRSPWVLASPALALLALVRPAALLWQLYRHDPAAVAAWDALPPPALGPCAGDGHGWIPLGLNLSAWHLVLDHLPRSVWGPAAASSAAADGAGPVAGADVRADADVLSAELAAGHFHSLAGLLGREAGFCFEAHRDGKRSAAEGDGVAADAADALVACLGGTGAGAAGRGEAAASGPFTLRLLHDGRPVRETDARCLTHPRPSPGAWRVEVWTSLPCPWGPGRRAPVLYSNRISVADLPPKVLPKPPEGT